MAFSLISEEEPANYRRIMDEFTSFMKLAPKTVIIERHLKLYRGLEQSLQQRSHIFFCYFHIQRTLKQQFTVLQGIMQEEYDKISELPVLESEKGLEEYLNCLNNTDFSRVSDPNS